MVIVDPRKAIRQSSPQPIYGLAHAPLVHMKLSEQSSNVWQGQPRGQVSTCGVPPGLFSVIPWYHDSPIQWPAQLQPVWHPPPPPPPPPHDWVAPGKTWSVWQLLPLHRAVPEMVSNRGKEG